MISVGVEYPALPSTVECVGVVGFILRLKAQVFSLILYNLEQLIKVRSVFSCGFFTENRGESLAL